MARPCRCCAALQSETMHRTWHFYKDRENSSGHCLLFLLLELPSLSLPLWLFSPHLMHTTARWDMPPNPKNLNINPAKDKVLRPEASNKKSRPVKPQDFCYFYISIMAMMTRVSLTIMIRIIGWECRLPAREWDNAMYSKKKLVLPFIFQFWSGLMTHDDAHKSPWPSWSG